MIIFIIDIFVAMKQKISQQSCHEVFRFRDRFGIKTKNIVNNMDKVKEMLLSIEYVIQLD